MAYIREYAHGVTVCANPHGVNGKRGVSLRQSNKGWTTKAAKALERRLMSMRIDYMAGGAWAFTLTLGAHWQQLTPAAFHNERKKYLQRIERAGVYAVQWAIEWQRRGAVHIHGCAFGLPEWTAAQQYAYRNIRLNLAMWEWAHNQPANSPFAYRGGNWQKPQLPHHPAMVLIDGWLSQPAIIATGAKPQGQHIAPITLRDEGRGWLRYVAKHSVKGANIAQRVPPKGQWQQPGRVYGFRGEWLEQQPTDWEYVDMWEAREEYGVEVKPRPDETKEEYRLRRAYQGFTRWRE